MSIDTSLIDKVIVGRVEPYIYAFKSKRVSDNAMKVGDTYRPVCQRMKEWNAIYGDVEHNVDWEWPAYISGKDVYFRDYDIHKYLEETLHRIRLTKRDFKQDCYYSNEFFESLKSDDIVEAISDINKDYKAGDYSKYTFYDSNKNQVLKKYKPEDKLLKPRENQQDVIDKFIEAVKAGKTNLLMYAVMRFGKTFTSMCCAKELAKIYPDDNKHQLIVVLSGKADVQDEWKRTVEKWDNFNKEYEFFSYEELDTKKISIDERLQEKRVVVFITFQGMLNKIDSEYELFSHDIDMLIIDETHFGARAEHFKQVYDSSTSLVKENQTAKKLDEDFLEETEVDDFLVKHKNKLHSKIQLHLSGTPYRILLSSEFKETEIIGFCQFADIVEAQKKWEEENSKSFLEDASNRKFNEWDNPYFGFPQLIRFAFNPSKKMRKRLELLKRNGITYSFSKLFEARKIDGEYYFINKENEDAIQNLLEVICGTVEDENLFGFLNYPKIVEGSMCQHIVFVLPYRAACDALERLILKPENKVRLSKLQEYEIINLSGFNSPRKYRDLAKVRASIDKFEAKGVKTISLTVNRLLTGATIPQWDTMLYFKDTSSPQEYDQAVFRLQSQNVKTYRNGIDEIKVNKKPQTLLIDFDPARLFKMQELKSQIYNVYEDKSGNSKLRQRIDSDLRISPIFIVDNLSKIKEIKANDVMDYVSAYSKDKGVMDELTDLSIDMSLKDYEEIWKVVQSENELGSKAGFSMALVEPEDESCDEEDGPNDDSLTSNSISKSSDNKKKDKEKDPVKQFKMYYSRILYFAFLIEDKVGSLEDVLSASSKNKRIFKNLGLNERVLQSMYKHMDKFKLRDLDYKIEHLNRLNRDESLEPLERASIAMNKFLKFGESQVVTSRKLSRDVLSNVPDSQFKSMVNENNSILDVAAKAGEFAVACVERFNVIGFTVDDYKNLIYSVPTSSITYEFTYKIYSLLGLNTDNIAAKFTSYDLCLYDETILEDIRLALSNSHLKFKDLDISKIGTLRPLKKQSKKKK